jgi:hypothetical protein
MGNRRGISKATLKVLQQAEEVPKELLSMSKRLLDSKELADVVTADHKLRDTIQQMSLPSILRRGTYLIPVDNVNTIDDIIRKHKDVARPALVDKFVSVYEERIAEAKEKLGPLFDRTQYPPAEDVRSYFWMEYRWESFAPPEQLESLNPTLYREAKERIQRDMDEATEEIRQALRVELLSLVEGLRKSLQGKREDGKPVKFYESGIEKVVTFMENFRARNVLGDGDLEKIVEDAKAVLGGVDASQVRTNEQFRAELGKSMAELKTSLDGLVVVKTRKFDFSQEAA